MDATDGRPNQDGSEGGDERAADGRPADRAGNDNDANSCENGGESVAGPGDQLPGLASFLVKERLETTAKARTALETTIPRLVEELVSLRNRLDKVDGEAKVFLDEISAAIEAMIFCVNDLKQWLKLALPPIASSVDTSLQMKTVALVTLERIDARCRMHVEKIVLHHLTRDTFAVVALKQPESVDCQRRLGSFDERSVWEWKMTIDELLADNEILVNFIDRHRQFLENSGPQDHDPSNMYR